MGWSDISISLSGPIVNSLILHFTDRWYVLSEAGPRRTASRKSAGDGADLKGACVRNYIFNQKYIARDEGKYQLIQPGVSHAGPSQSLLPEGGQFLGLHHHFRRGLSRMLRGRTTGRGSSASSSPAMVPTSSSLEAALPGPLAIKRSTRLPMPISRQSPMRDTSYTSRIRYVLNEPLLFRRGGGYSVLTRPAQFFITATSDKQHPVKNKIGAAIVDRILRAHNNSEDFHVIVIMPAVPAFAGDLKSDGALGTRAIMEFQCVSGPLLP